MRTEHGHGTAQARAASRVLVGGGFPAADFAASLVEFNSDLEEIGETPLEHYVDNDRCSFRGITALSYLADGSIVFATSVGHLYRILPSANGPAEVVPLGWFHPEGGAYTAPLFALDGERLLAGVAQRRGRPHEWLTYDLKTGRSVAHPFELVGSDDQPRKGLALYGSITRDNFGACYVAGRYIEKGREVPPALRVELSDPPRSVLGFSTAAIGSRNAVAVE